MRRINAVLTALILVLTLLHGIFGSLMMFGISGTALTTMAWVLVALIVAHVVISTKLTIDTLRIQRQTGTAYFKENKVFWARRISGFAIMALILLHLTAFGYTEDGVYRLRWFTIGRLITQLSLVAAIAVHAIANMKPLLIGLGIKSMRQWIGDILVILSVLLLFMAVALFIYYLRWNVW